jgi:hypothetical protein
MTAKQATLSGERKPMKPFNLRLYLTFTGLFLFAFLCACVLFGMPPHVLQAEVTKDGAYRVELADYDTPKRYEIFSTRVATGVRKRISAPMPAGMPPEGWDCASFILSTDQTRVVYRSGRAAFGDYILSSTPIYQQAAFRISGPSGGQVFPGYFAFAPASIVYSTDLIPGGPQTTWVVPVAGGVSVGLRKRQSCRLVGKERVMDFENSPETNLTERIMREIRRRTDAHESTKLDTSRYNRIYEGVHAVLSAPDVKAKL